MTVLQQYRNKFKYGLGFLSFVSEIDYTEFVKFDDGYKDIPKREAMILASFLKCDYRELMGDDNG